MSHFLTHAETTNKLDVIIPNVNYSNLSRVQTKWTERERGMGKDHMSFELRLLLCQSTKWTNKNPFDGKTRMLFSIRNPSEINIKHIQPIHTSISAAGLQWHIQMTEGVVVHIHSRLTMDILKIQSKLNCRKRSEHFVFVDLFGIPFIPLRLPPTLYQDRYLKVVGWDAIIITWRFFSLYCFKTTDNQVNANELLGFY